MPTKTSLPQRTPGRGRDGLRSSPPTLEHEKALQIAEGEDRSSCTRAEALDYEAVEAFAELMAILREWDEAERRGESLEPSGTAEPAMVARDEGNP